MSDKPTTSFLDRWARRKQEQELALRQKRTESGDVEHAPSRGDKAGASRGDTVGMSRGDQTEVSRGDTSAPPAAEPPAPPLPAIEDLTADSDITGFLRKGVSEDLKRLALRRMWSLDPQIRDFIEVAENQYDWNAVDGVPGFGALDSGTDVQALLAQATGAASPNPPLEESSTVVADTPADLTATATDTEGIADPVRTTDTQADATPPATASADERTRELSLGLEGHHPLEPEDRSPPAAGRRRHGGALPS